MDDKINVCLLNDSFYPIVDGVVNVISNYAENLLKHNVNPTIVTPYYPNVKDNYAYDVVRFPSVNSQRFFGYRSGNPFTPKVISGLADKNFDIIHCHCPFASGYLARLLRQRTKAPLIFTYHTKFDYDIRRTVKIPALQSLGRSIVLANISACDEVWTVSQGAADDLHALGYKGNCIVMKNGVDLPKGRMSTEVTNELKEKHNIPYNVPVFLFAGRLQWYKGIKLICDSLKVLSSEGKDFRMVFVGTGMEEREIKSYIKALGISDKCIFTGVVRERMLMRKYYSMADVFLFPSLFDTNGIVVREAAACATPAVLIKDSCAAEDIVDYENGFLCENNVDSFSSLLKHIYNEDMNTVHRIGENAMNSLYMSWSDAVNCAYDRYNIVIENAKSSSFSKNLHKDSHFIVNTDRMLKSMSDIRKLATFNKKRKNRV